MRIAGENEREEWERERDKMKWERENQTLKGIEGEMEREQQNNDYLSNLAKHIRALYVLLKCMKLVVTQQITEPTVFITINLKL